MNTEVVKNTLTTLSAGNRVQKVRRPSGEEICVKDGQSCIPDDFTGNVPG